MRIALSFLVFITTTSLFSQDSLLIGRKYFEDQIYVGVTYNTLTYKPIDLEQKGLSTGIQLGFIKDIPLNKKGSIALGIGLGYALNRYNANLKIAQNEPIYSLIQDSYLKNKLVTHRIEIPFEVRFRITSTPTVYQFWRIYVGGKVSYTFASNSHFQDELEEVKTRQIANLKQINFGPQLAIGYNAINFYAYYNINPLFSTTENTKNIGISDVRKLSVGIQFYIF